MPNLALVEHVPWRLSGPCNPHDWGRGEKSA